MAQRFARDRTGVGAGRALAARRRVDAAARLARDRPLSSAAADRGVGGGGARAGDGGRGRDPAGAVARGPRPPRRAARSRAGPVPPARGSAAAGLASGARRGVRPVPGRGARPLEGPEHGMAYDVQRFNELTKQMSAYAHVTRAEHAAAGRGAGPAAGGGPPARRADQPAAALPRGAATLPGAAGAGPARLRAPGPPGSRAAALRRRRARGRLAELRDERRARPARTPGRGRPLPRRRHVTRARWGLPEPRWGSATSTRGSAAAVLGVALAPRPRRRPQRRRR